MRFGAHVTAAKGYRQMARYARQTGCECVQIFAKSPRQWQAKPLSDERLKEMRDLIDQGAVCPVNTHTSYLLNLSTDNDELREKSIAALADELVRAAQLGCTAVNTHVGTASAAAPADAAAADGEPLSPESARAAERAGQAAVRAWELAERQLADLGEEARLTTPVLLFEDTAGAGTTFGSSVSELAAAIAASGLGADRLGICIDTCHAWAAGYPLDGAEGWDALLGRIDGLMGIDRLQLLHLNDCLHGCGQHKDRHAWIGRGRISAAGFAALVADPRLARLDAVLEMPGQLPEKDEVNLGVLKALRDGLGPKEAVAAGAALHPGATQ